MSPHRLFDVIKSLILYEWATQIYNSATAKFERTLFMLYFRYKINPYLKYDSNARCFQGSGYNNPIFTKSGKAASLSNEWVQHASFCLGCSRWWKCEKLSLSVFLLL